MALATLPPPIPDGGLLEVQRVDHTRLRRRLLYSEHEPDLVARLKKNIGHVRRAAWGQPDLTANPYLTMWTNAAALYDAEPEVMAPEGSEGLLTVVAETGLWAQQQRVQRDTLALREMFVRADIDDDEASSSFGQLSYRPVFPDMVAATTHPRRPGSPVRIREWVEDDRFGWVLHDLDVRGPSYQVWTADKNNVTKDVLGGTFDGDAYPYRDGMGNPILPYATYHAAATGCMFDPYTHREVVEGSLNIGVLLTFYGHLVRNAAWAQRYAVNLEPVGLSVESPEGADSGRRDVVSDPATLLCLRYVDGATQGQVGQWSAPGDPEAVLRSIGMYERRIQLLAGFAPPDVTRQEADIRSGYSLAVDRESLRSRQRVFEPQFRRGDQELLRISACLSNRTVGTTYSERPLDYRPVYQGLPESPGEVRLRLDQVKAKRDARMIGPVTAIREFRPELSYDEAVLELAKVRIEELDVEVTVKGLLTARGVTEEAQGANGPPEPPKGAPAPAKAEEAA